MGSRKAMIGLFLIFLLGLSLRLYHLDEESLWVDEGFTVHHAQSQQWDTFISRISEEAAPPGHYLFLHYWMRWFGNSEFSVRFPSVLFGVLSIWLLFLIVRKMWNTKVALLAALFMATSMLQVLYSQEARLYSMFTFLVLLSAYFFIDIVLSLRPERSLILYFVTAAAMLAVNYLAVVVIGLYSIIVWMRRAHLSPLLTKKWFLYHFFLIGAAIVLLWPMIYSQFILINTGLSAILIRKGLPSVLASLGIFFYALPPLAILVIAAFLLRWRAIIVRVIANQQFNLFFSFLVIAAGSTYLYFSFFPVTVLNIPITRFPITHSYFLIRHSFFLAPAWYVFLAWKISSLKWKKVAIITAIIVLMVSATALHWYYTETTKPEWREAAAFIVQQDESPLILIDKGSAISTFLLDYYLTGKYRLVRLTSSERPRDFSQLSPAEVWEHLQGEHDFWLVLAGNSRTGYYYRDLLDERYKRELSQEFYQIEVYRYRVQ